MTPTQQPRKKKFVDRQLQGVLVLRVALYWFLCLGTITFMLVAWLAVTGPARGILPHFQELWFRYSPIVIATVFLLPILIIDAITLSNRFAGPMKRLLGAMERLADGENVEPITFRQDDFWHEFAEQFNRVAARLQASQRSREKVEAEPSVH